MSFLGFAVAAAHVAVGAVWLGAMTYSIAVVQPRAARLLGRDRFEELAVTLAAGARWTVLAMCAATALTGAGLAGLVYADGRPGAAWIGAVAAKTALLLATVAVFGYVSWRLWPARLFALPAELPGLHRAFKRAAYVLIGLVGANLVLGVAAHTLFGPM